MEILKFVSKFSPAIPLIIGIALWHRIPRIYRPLTIYCLLSLICEIISTILLSSGKSNSIDLNIFNLFEFLTLGVLFKGLNEVIGSEWRIRIVLMAGTVLWIVENIILQRIDENSIAVHLLYCAVFVVLSVNQINQVMVKERGNLYVSPDFIISSAALIFFSYSILFEVPYLLKIEKPLTIYILMANIFLTLNMALYLSFAIALLWMPTRRKFTMPY